MFFYHEPNYIEKFLWKIVFQIFAKTEMTRKENRSFGHHFVYVCVCVCGVCVCGGGVCGGGYLFFLLEYGCFSVFMVELCDEYIIV